MYWFENLTSYTLVRKFDVIYILLKIEVITLAFLTSYRRLPALRECFRGILNSNEEQWSKWWLTYEVIAVIDVSDVKSVSNDVNYGSKLGFDVIIFLRITRKDNSRRL